MALAFLASEARKYEARRRQVFVPPSVTLKRLREAVPKDAFRKSTVKGVCYVVRSICMAGAFFRLATCIDPLAACLSAPPAVRWGLWIVYWFFQSLAWGGLWTLGAWGVTVVRPTFTLISTGHEVEHPQP